MATRRSHFVDTYDDITVGRIGFTQFIVGYLRLKITDVQCSCRFHRVLVDVRIGADGTLDKVYFVVF